ncbi:MAG: peroxidase family protein [Candidatus Hodgkinia cicadicola]
MTNFRQVDDVDIYSGALSELPIQGGILGPTLTCLISDQFVRLKQGDSFWYENPFLPQGFTTGNVICVCLCMCVCVCMCAFIFF